MSDYLANEYSHWSVELDYEKIFWLTLNVPNGHNKFLSIKAFSELNQIIENVEVAVAAGEVSGLVIYPGLSNKFPYVTDYNELKNLQSVKKIKEQQQSVHEVFRRIEKLKVPVVAALDGQCIGASLELALAANYRIATEHAHTQFGFPNIRLGLVPGFGGMARALWQLGSRSALDLMLTGKLISATKAYSIQLVDMTVASSDSLRWQARRAIIERKKSKPSVAAKAFLSIAPLRARLARELRTETAKKLRPTHYPAQFALIDAYEKFGDDYNGLIEAEIDLFAHQILSSPVNNLQRVKMLSDSLIDGIAADRPEDMVLHVHIIGAGVMGADIAILCAYQGYSVSLQDQNPLRLQSAKEQALLFFKSHYKTSAQVAAAVSRLNIDAGGKFLSRCSVLIEAVTENVEMKQRVLKDVEVKIPKTALLATATSAIPLEDIANALENPARLVGLHFFNPAINVPLVEIVKSPSVVDAIIMRAKRFVVGLGKKPLVVKSQAGFLVNRALMPYMLDALDRVDKGESPEQLDAAAMAFGMPIGPIELLDRIGLDVVQMVAEQLEQKILPKSRAANLLEQGFLGRKVGRGFYVWEKGDPIKDIAPPHGNLAGLGRDLVEPMVDMVEQIIADGVVENADSADIGMILATGFPPFLGGPIHAREEGNA